LAAASAGAVEEGRFRSLCSIVDEAVIAAVPIAPASKPLPIVALMATRCTFPVTRFAIHIC
jgi:hypothetical protein